MKKITTYAAFRPILATIALLLIPLIAMQFSSEVNWTGIDFIFMGALIFGTGLTYEIVTRKSGRIVYRFAVGFALLTGFLLLWVDAAVGLIGASGNPFNLIYLGVIAVGIVGAIIAHFKSEKMVFTMIVMAVAQTLIALITLILGMYNMPGSSVVEIIGVNGFFITLFLVSALLFRYATQKQAKENAKTDN